MLLCDFSFVEPTFEIAIPATSIEVDTAFLGVWFLLLFNMPVPSALNALLTELNAAAKAYSDKNGSDEDKLSPYAPEARTLSRVAEELADLLKPVEEQIWTFIFQPSALACANIAFDCGLLAPWPKSEMSAQELAVFTGANEKLICEFDSALGDLVSLP